MEEPWLTALAIEAALLAVGLLLLLPGQRRRTELRMPGFAERYVASLLAVAAVFAAVLLLRLLQPAVTPEGAIALGPALSEAARLADGGLRNAFDAVASAEVDLIASVVLVLLHPAMLALAPLVWLATDEERQAKGVLIAYAVFLVLATPLHYLLLVQTVPVRPFPLLPEVAALYYAPGADKVPGIYAGLALCVALSGRRSRNRRLRGLALVHPWLVAPALLYMGVNGVVGVASGFVVALLAVSFARRAVSVERIAHQRIDASPERKMAIRQAADALLAALREAARVRGLEGVTPRLVGSVAKDTYLAHKVDIDAFVMFPPTTPRADLEAHGLALGRAVLEDPEERYAEHPYLAGTWQGVEAEVVPAYEVTDPAQRMSAVDRTPFHTDYVVRGLEGLQRNEVRLLKQFLLGIGVYGAETKVQGFSGYLAELLVLKHGTFRGVLRAGADWRVGHLIALEPFEGVPRFPEPLVVIDPVDPTRNVASAVSLDSFLLFQEAARAYMAEPRLSFFFPRAVRPLPRPRLRETLARRGHALIALRLPRPDILDDALHAQLRKCGQAAAEALERGGFKPLTWEGHVDEGHATVALEMEQLAINEREVHEGPPVREKEHAERFRAKWTGNPRALSAVYEEGGKLMVARRRSHTNAAAYLRASALDLDLGKDLRAVSRARGFEVLETDEALAQLDPTFLTGFLLRARPWER